MTCETYGAAVSEVESNILECIWIQSDNNSTLDDMIKTGCILKVKFFFFFCLTSVIIIRFLMTIYKYLVYNHKHKNIFLFIFVLIYIGI
jgi:hypothetical protein